jgi:hypothetical protein
VLTRVVHHGRLLIPPLETSFVSVSNWLKLAHSSRKKSIAQISVFVSSKARWLFSSGRTSKSDRVAHTDTFGAFWYLHASLNERPIPQNVSATVAVQINSQTG